MTGKQPIIIALTVLSLAACSAEDRRTAKATAGAAKPDAPIIVKARPKVMTAEQKAELAFPPDVIAQVEAAAGAAAEPFFEDVMMRSANLKGDVMIATAKLSGFSVHTKNAEEIIAGLSRSFRSRGFLIFLSEQNYGNVPDVVTVVRGESSYDILRIQKTEAPHYHLDTASIIKWLRVQQKQGSFIITGAGADWLEASFIKQPRNMRRFAGNVASFAPDVLREGPSSVDKIADRMATTNGFRLVWD
jgi:hypothetical protein